MGGAVAAYVAASGLSVIGFDIDDQASSSAKAAGVTIVKNATSVVEQAEITLLSLPHPRALNAVVEELAKISWQDRIIIETGTFKLDDKFSAKEKLEGAGLGVLDCPISGTGHQARSGDLVIFTSGDEKLVLKCAQVLEAFSRDQKYCGAFGNGIRMKYVANHLIAIHNVAAAEAIVLGLKAGLDPKLVFDTLEDSAGTSRMFQVRGPMMVDNNYDDVSATNTLFNKDLDIISDFVAKLDCSLPLFSLAAEPYRAIMETDLADKDTAAVCRLIEERNGIKRQ